VDLSGLKSAERTSPDCAVGVGSVRALCGEGDRNTVFVQKDAILLLQTLELPTSQLADAVAASGRCLRPQFAPCAPCTAAK